MDKREKGFPGFLQLPLLETLLGAPFRGYILQYLGKNGVHTLSHFHIAYGICGLFGLISLAFTLKAFFSENREIRQNKISLTDTWQKFSKGIKEVMSDYRVIITSNMEGIQNISVGTLEAFLPVYAVTVAGLNAFQAGILWGAQIVTTILAKPIMGKISDRYGRIPIIISGMWICAIPFACIPLTRDFYLLLSLSAVFGVGEAFVTSSSAAMVAEFCKEQHYGAARWELLEVSLIWPCRRPYFGGFLLAHLSYQYSFLIIATLLILASFVFVLTVFERKAINNNPFLPSQGGDEGEVFLRLSTLLVMDTKTLKKIGNSYTI